ncbi:hypothetical protein NP233_g88 [Leucocoprinus birnbaumii]|uniref:Uncharacterized protein n=1 Tax=Leucocoprinus birnbaumii TaxID=56174 RepID=A0AAD5W310_9AGAR|nr:hypothetical protein NP233_g88 [Leucocoprinus birnbaumii]
MVLEKMEGTTETFLSRKVTHVVIAVLAYFNNARRQATKDAGTIADHTVLCIIDEPAATIIVQSPDSGVSDASLLSIDDGNDFFETLTHTKCEELSVDNRVIDHLIKSYKKKVSTGVSKNLCALGRLKREVEKAKRTLPSQQPARIKIGPFEDGNDFSVTLAHFKFGKHNVDLFRKTMKPAEQVLKDLNVKKEDIDKVRRPNFYFISVTHCLVGGSTRIPKVQQLLEESFNGKEPSKRIHPGAAVAYGVAVRDGILSGAEGTANVVLIDVSPLTLGIEATGGVFTRLMIRAPRWNTEYVHLYRPAKGLSTLTRGIIS